MMIRIKQVVLIFVLALSLFFYGCFNNLSKSEEQFLTELTESDGFDYSFNDEGLVVKIYDSKIVGTNDISDFSPVISAIFFRVLVSKRKMINTNGAIILKYINNKQEVFISETPYNEIVVFEKLVSNFEEIINNYPSDDINSLINNRVVKKQVDSIVRPYKIKDINIYKYSINIEKGLHYLYWMIDRDDKIIKIKTVFDESNKLVNITQLFPDVRSQN